LIKIAGGLTWKRKRKKRRCVVSNSSRVRDGINLRKEGGAALDLKRIKKLAGRLFKKDHD